MHPTPGVSNRLPANSSPGELLGLTSPLVRTLDRLSLLVKQTLVVSVLLSASVVALLEGDRSALPLVIAAATVHVGLVVDAAFVALRKRELAVDLIMEGRGQLPIPAIERERRRLLEPRRRHELAAWLDATRIEAQQPIRRPRCAAPIFDVRVVRAVSSELATIAATLRAGDVGVRGVAMTERLLRDGGSWLYRDDVNALRDHLHRIQYLFAIGDAEPAMGVTALCAPADNSAGAGGPATGGT
jgi:hypothetical protein